MALATVTKTKFRITEKTEQASPAQRLLFTYVFTNIRTNMNRIRLFVCLFAPLPARAHLFASVHV